MSTNELLKLSEKLQKESAEIVTKLNLIQIANKYCECHQIGSSVMGLMVDEDIDFTCYINGVVDIDKCFQFAKEIIITTDATKLKIKNYLNKDPFYQFKVEIDPYNYNGTDWDITFSFQTKTDHLVKVEVDKVKWVLERLTPENKITILELKMESRKQGIKIPGVVIYDAVLEHGISSFDGLVKFTSNAKT